MSVPTRRTADRLSGPQPKAPTERTGSPAQPFLESNPFKFLEYYEERDADVFGGRERESQEIADRITQARTHIFYGRSGLGKTSLLLAGVFPELRRRGWLPVHIRTLADPTHDLLLTCETLLRSLDPDALPHELLEDCTPRERVLATLRALADERRLVLVLDQFEEFFIRFRQNPEVRAEFVSLIAAIAREKRMAVHVLFSLREDYLAEMDDFRNELPDLFEDEYRLRAMTAFGVRQAVTRPLDAADVSYQGRMVTRLLDRLSERRFDPVVLQILCNEIYGLARSRVRADADATLELRAEDLDEVGDIDQVFRRYLDAAAAKLDADQQLVARGVLRCLTTQEHTKQALQLHDFTHAFVRLSEHEAQSVLELLAAHRLIRIDPRGQELGAPQIWYELTHDRLVPIITEWLRLDVEFNRLLAAEDLISTTVRSGLWRENAENLLGPGHLDNVVGPFRTRLRLSADKLEFVLRSAIYHHHADVADWVREYDEAKPSKPSEALVLELIASKNEQMRRGAVFTAGHLGRLDEALTDALVDACLDDEAESVRRAAGTAIGFARSPRLLARLLQRGQQHDTGRLVAALAEIHAGGYELAGVPVWLRWRAQRLTTRRAASQHHAQIAEARPVAAIGALLAGLLWIVLLMPYGAMWSFGFTATRAMSTAQVFWLSSAGLVAMVMSCVPLAWELGGATVLRVHARARASWAATVAGTWTYRVSGLVLFLVVLPTLSATKHLWAEDFDNAPLVLALAMSFWLLLPASVELTRRAISGARSFTRANAWSAIGALGLPLAIPWAMIGFSGLEGTMVLAVAGLMWSALTATASASLARVGLELPGLQLLDSKPHDRSRDMTRGALLGLSLTSLMFVLGSVGLRVVPWPGVDAELDDDGQVAIAGELDPYGGVPAIRYHHVRIGDGGSEPTTQLDYVLDLSPHGSGYALFVNGEPAGSASDGPRTLLAVPGRHEFAFVATQQPADYTLELDGRGRLGNSPLELRDDAIRYVWTAWSSGDKSPEFAGADIVGELSGRAKPNDLIRVSFGERFVIDRPPGNITGIQLHCQGDAIGLQVESAMASSKLDVADPIVEAPSLDADLAATCTTYADDRGAWTLRFGATVSPRPSTPLADLRIVAAVRREHDAGERATAAEPDAPLNQQLDGENLSYKDYTGKTLRASSFRGADLSGVSFKLADLGVDEFADAGSGAVVGNDFREATGAWTDFGGAILTAANFSNAKLASPQFQGVRRASDAKFLGAELIEAKFDDAGIEGADFSAATLTRASFTNAHARAAVFRDANLSQADFTGADLSEVDFTGADLRGAVLDLRTPGPKPVFDNAKLDGAWLLVNDGFKLGKQTCGSGHYTLIEYTTDKSGSTRASERKVPLPPCSKPIPSIAPVPETLEIDSPELLRGACRTAPTPVGIFRAQAKQAEEVCRQHPAQRGPSTSEQATGRQTWSTGKQVDGIEVVCSCELRSDYTNRAPNNQKGDRRNAINLGGPKQGPL